MARQWTEAEITKLLVHRFSSKVQEYSIFPGLRNCVGFAKQERIIDIFLVRNYQPRGTMAIEIKVNRSDWLKELGQPEKAWEFDRQVNQFFVAAPASVVQLHEVPSSWGWFCVSDTGSITIKKHPTRNDEAKMTENLTYSLLRAGAAIRTQRPWVFEYAGRSLSEDELVVIATREYNTTIEKQVQAQIQRDLGLPRRALQSYELVQRIKRCLNFYGSRDDELVDIIQTLSDTGVDKAMTLMRRLEGTMDYLRRSVTDSRKAVKEVLAELEKTGVEEAVLLEEIPDKGIPADLSQKWAAIELDKSFEDTEDK